MLNAERTFCEKPRAWRFCHVPDPQNLQCRREMLQFLSGMTKAT
jgi:hypothetical protein